MSTQKTTSVQWQLWIVAFGFFMQTLDSTIVNTALPSMAASLGENPLRMQSVIVAYLLTVAVILPASGWLADRFGVQRIFFSAITLFTLGSLLCAQADTLRELIAYRVLQGIGGAMMVPVGRLTVMKIVPRDQYMAAMIFVLLPGQIGPLLGPVLGGFLVQYASWHWIFLINIPVGIAGAIATLLLLPNYRLQGRRFDFKGFILLTISMVTLTLALDGHQGLGLSTVAVTGLAILGVSTLLVYWWYARGNQHALFSLSLFDTATFRIGMIGNLLGRIGSGMLPFMTPLFLQVGMGFSPFHAGLMMVPMVFGSISMNRMVVRVVSYFGYRNVLVVTTLLLALLSLSLPLTAWLGWISLLPVVMFLLGMVNSLRFSAMNTLTLKDLPESLASSGNSLHSMVMQLSMSLGVSIAGMVIGSFSRQHLITDSAAIHSIFIYSYGCMALIIALPALAFAFVPTNTSPDRTLATKPIKN